MEVHYNNSQAPEETKMNNAILENLLNKTEEALDLRDLVKAKILCNEFAGLSRSSFTGSEEKSLYNKLKDLCANSDNPNVVIGGGDDEDTYWEDIKTRVDNAEFLHEQKELYKQYIRKHGNGKYVPFAKEEIKKIDGRIAKLSGKDKKKQEEQAKKEKERKEAIVNNFRVVEERHEDEGDNSNNWLEIFR